MLHSKQAQNNWALNNFKWTLEDYRTRGFPRRYIDALFRPRAQQTKKVLTTIAEKDPCLTTILHLLCENDKQKPRPLRVVDIAGGPGCAAFGVGAFLAENNLPFSVLVLDPVPEWKAACEVLYFEFKSKKSNDLACMAEQCDDADIVVISHAHVDFAEMRPDYLRTLIDSVAERCTTVCTFVVWLDRFCNVDPRVQVKGKKKPTWSLTWEYKCLKSKQDSKETCLVGCISGPKRNTSDRRPPCEHKALFYKPVVITDDTETFYVAQSAFKKAGMKYHTDRACKWLSGCVKGPSVMSAVDVRARQLELCKTCARGSGNCNNELELKCYGNHFKKVLKKMEKEKAAKLTDRRI